MTSSIPTNVYSAPHVRHVLQSQKLMQMRNHDQENLLAAASIPEKYANNRMVVPEISIEENYDVSDRRRSCVMESFLQFWPAMRRPSSPGHLTCESNKEKLSLKMPCRLHVEESDDRHCSNSPPSAPIHERQPPMPSHRAKSIDNGQVLNDEKSLIDGQSKNTRFRFFSGQY
uniref:Uncharacterized protein n=1 Tax=Romanomermis culicivorax TaxID=13658 RepID=A0A915I321_ROMCU